VSHQEDRLLRFGKSDDRENTGSKYDFKALLCSYVSIRNGYYFGGRVEICESACRYMIRHPSCSRRNSIVARSSWIEN
jgi:hypothetical protein